MQCVRSWRLWARQCLICLYGRTATARSSQTILQPVGRRWSLSWSRSCYSPGSCPGPDSCSGSCPSPTPAPAPTLAPTTAPAQAPVSVWLLRGAGPGSCPDHGFKPGSGLCPGSYISTVLGPVMSQLLSGPGSYSGSCFHPCSCPVSSPGLGSCPAPAPASVPAPVPDPARSRLLHQHRLLPSPGSCLSFCPSPCPNSCPISCPSPRPAGVWIVTRPAGGGGGPKAPPLRSPKLLDRFPNFKRHSIALYVNYPDKVKNLTRRSLMTSQVRSKSEFSTFRAW